MAQCLIGLGSNLGDRASLLDVAIQNLSRVAQTTLLAKSRYHETPPIGGPAEQHAFLNGAALVDTALAPTQLLDEVATIEKDLGRQRVIRWGPRAIDLDLLLYDDLVIDSNDLQIPHPRMAWRRFVLVPSAEVAPTMPHPKIGWTVEQLLRHLDTATDYLPIAGLAGAGKNKLAQNAIAQLGGSLVTDPVTLEHAHSDTTKSYGIELQAEIEFAKQRAEAISTRSARWNERRRLWISDFWVGQSSVTIRALSEGSRREALLRQWQAATQDACPPKITVFLDATPSWCHEQLARRGKPKPPAKLLPTFEALRKQMIEQTSQPGCGPVLTVDAQRPEHALEELVAAVLAMKSRTHHEL